MTRDFTPVLAFALALGLSSQAGAAPSFSKDVAPILKTRCATCHLTGQEAGRLALHPGAAYASLVGVASIEGPLKRVEPGKPDASYLIAKLEGSHVAKGGKGARMPFGAAPLPKAQIDLIRGWIAAGAKKD